MQKISFAGCLGLPPAVSSQFSVEMCAASKNCEKFTDPPFLGGGRLRSFKVIDVDKSKKHVTSPCYDMQHVCILYLSTTVCTAHHTSQ